MSRLKNFFLVAVLLSVISSLSLAQTPILAQDIAETDQLNNADCGCGNVRRNPAIFAEVEILLSSEFNLTEISALPTAPGSDLEVLDNPKRVVVQLPASTVKALNDAGAEITVQKNFILFEGAKGAYAEDGDVTAMGSCTGPYQEGVNNTGASIIEYPGYGDPIFMCGRINISGAPPGSMVSCIDVGWNINHSRPSDLVILLTDWNMDIIHPLWEFNYASPGEFTRTKTGITVFSSELVNQTWILCLLDFEKGSTGYINSWWIKVYYTEGELGCSGPHIYGENNTDVRIPDNSESGAFSEINITTAPPGSSVKCIDVHYEIIHTYVGDLKVLLTDSDGSHTHTLWDRQGGSDDNINETKTGITKFIGEPVNQKWILWAADLDSGSSGRIDYWWIKIYYEEFLPPPNDDCADAIAVQEAIPYQGSTVGATGAYESSCSFKDTADVWHSYTPTNTGLVIISLAGSTFDTTLAVFDQCEGNDLACNDDLCDAPNSEITMLMTGGNTYLIRVAGFNGATGNYTLTVTTSPAILLSKPNSPSPVDGAADVPADTILSWSCTIAETNKVQNDGLVTAFSKDTDTQKYIFGKDDRLEEFQVEDPNILTAGDATAALMPRDFLTDNDDGTFTVLGTTFAEWYLQITGRPICPDEPYRNQPSPGECTGFLVAPDIIATTGHCECPEDCLERAVVFGFVMLDTYTPVLRLDKSEVYYCKEVIARQSGDPDWAIVRLDRNVTGHNPLPLRHAGIVSDNEPLIVIGYPMSVPRKYAVGATVRDNTASAYFQANLDSNIGGSGSAVLSTNTLVVEGVLYSGPMGFVPDGPCDRSFVCPDTGCSEWPNFVYSTRATEFSPLIPLFDVYLGTDPFQLNLSCSDVAVPWCASGPLQASKKYYWKVVAKNCYGQTEGPVWSFTTKAD